MLTSRSIALPVPSSMQQIVSVHPVSNLNSNLLRAPKFNCGVPYGTTDRDCEACFCCQNKRRVWQARLHLSVSQKSRQLTYQAILLNNNIIHLWKMGPPTIDNETSLFHSRRQRSFQQDGMTQFNYRRLLFVTNCIPYAQLYARHER